MNRQNSKSKRKTLKSKKMYGGSVSFDDRFILKNSDEITNHERPKLKPTGYVDLKSTTGDIMEGDIIEIKGKKYIVLCTRQEYIKNSNIKAIGSNNMEMGHPKPLYITPPYESWIGTNYLNFDISNSLIDDLKIEINNLQKIVKQNKSGYYKQFLSQLKTISEILGTDLLPKIIYINDNIILVENDVIQVANRMVNKYKAWCEEKQPNLNIYKRNNKKICNICLGSNPYGSKSKKKCQLGKKKHRSIEETMKKKKLYNEDILYILRLLW